MDEQAWQLAVIREWAETGIMRRAWPPGEGTAVMLELRRELLWLLELPAAQIMFAFQYLRGRYGQMPPAG